MGNIKPIVVPANHHKGCAGLGPSPVQAFENMGGLDSSLRWNDEYW